MVFLAALALACTVVSDVAASRASRLGALHDSLPASFPTSGRIGRDLLMGKRPHGDGGYWDGGYGGYWDGGYGGYLDDSVDWMGMTGGVGAQNHGTEAGTEAMGDEDNGDVDMGDEDNGDVDMGDEDKGIVHSGEVETMEAQISISATEEPTGCTANADDALERTAECPTEGVCKVAERWRVCLQGTKQTFGSIANIKTSDHPCEVEVRCDGKVFWSERCGGFDGYWSINAGDSHEVNMAKAVKAMIGDTAATPGSSAGNNEDSNEFLKVLRDVSEVVDLDYPDDEKLADDGERKKNILKLNKATEDHIWVTQC